MQIALKLLRKFWKPAAIFLIGCVLTGAAAYKLYQPRIELLENKVSALSVERDRAKNELEEVRVLNQKRIENYQKLEAQVKKYEACRRNPDCLLQLLNGLR